MSNKYRIMFVCTGNTCRSPMAEVALRMLLDKKRPGKFEVVSSGTGAASGFPATMYAGEAAKIWDCDLSGHHSQQLSRDLIDNSDLIFALAPEHYDEIVKLAASAKARTYLFKNFPETGRAGEPVVDPIGQSLERYNETFLEIGEYLGKYLDEIAKRIDEHSDA